MTEKQELRRIDVECTELNGFDGSFVEFIRLLETILCAIPEEYRASTLIRHAIDYDWGSDGYEIFYRRPSTPEDIKADAEAELERWHERHVLEHQQYERLRAKFEGGE